ncbi:hypothetical protein [Capnocytophaga sp. oral taxon 878]|uniref:hypothetical protein n=1 Tax=Capnocytophaga sp. oral taxon 878 TaxID=1316596 RepID=UPI000D042AEC|nr:hypothetical protein [Capnocytophaga sp. oral taxon 878]AVM50208.1 hypothetical protein C4H12_06860 [Capnocytophaga sp. oral taxon 878]
MKSVSQEVRAKNIRDFSISFTMLIVMFFLCCYITISIAEEGINLLEEKRNKYEQVFKQQAELNFMLDDLNKKLFALRSKKRNAGEHKQLQKIISEAREELEKDIDTTKVGNEHYTIYSQLLSQVREIQTVMDLYEIEDNKRSYYIEQLEKCKQIYQDLSRQRSSNNKATGK